MQLRKRLAASSSARGNTDFTPLKTTQKEDQQILYSLPTKLLLPKLKKKKIQDVEATSDTSIYTSDTSGANSVFIAQDNDFIV